MKKIILALEGTHFSEGAFEFSRKLNELQPILLTGVFLPQTELANLWSYADAISPNFIPTVEGDEAELVLQNIARFERLCQDNEIAYSIHKDYYNLALPELKKESRYADLLILGSEVFYENIGIQSSYDYLADVLHTAACPVLVVPEKFNFPERIILAYDGTDESVYAIKQFAYLFPELTGRQTLLIYANEKTEEDFPDKMQIEELASRHYTDLTLFKLDISPKKYFNAWVTDTVSTLLISGSFGRSGLSQLFKRSFVRDIIADHKVPVFIAHK